MNTAPASAINIRTEQAPAALKAPVAKRIEQEGWDYPKHLAGRAFGVVAHGDERCRPWHG